MNYELELSKSTPYLFNPLNGSKPPLVSGAGSSTLLSASTTLAFPAYRAGYSHIPFSMEVWFLPVTHNNTGEVVVIGHANEGIIWNGQSFILRINQGANPAIQGTYTPQQNQAFHIVATYDTSKMALFLNGERVIELDVPGDFTGTTDVLLHSLSGGAVTSALYDSAALYVRSLTDNEIKDHYSWGNEILDSYEIAMLRGGWTWRLMYSDVEISEKIVYSGDSWSQGIMTGLSVVDNLIPDTTGSGTWRHGIPLGAITPETTTSGVHITYVGQGVTLEYSTNGTTWIAVSNKSTILEGTSTTGLTLLIRLTVSATGWVESLVLDVLKNRILSPYSGVRYLHFKSAALDQSPGNQLDYHQDWGADLMTNGYLQIEPDATDTPRSIGTVEVWARVRDTAGILLSFGTTNRVSIASGSYTFNGVTAYRNGVAVANGVYPANEWAHWVFVLTTKTNSVIRIGGNSTGSNMLDATIGHVALYQDQLTASQVSSLYNANIGAPALRVDDVGEVSLTGHTPEAEIFAYSWSYVTGGG